MLLTPMFNSTMLLLQTHREYSFQVTYLTWRNDLSIYLCLSLRWKYWTVVLRDLFPLSCHIRTMIDDISPSSFLLVEQPIHAKRFNSKIAKVKPEFKWEIARKELFLFNEIIFFEVDKSIFYDIFDKVCSSKSISGSYPQPVIKYKVRKHMRYL